MEDNAERCRCGARYSDWIDPDTGVDYYPPPFRATVRQCRACIARSDALEPFADDPDRHAFAVVLEAVDPNSDSADDEPEVALGDMPE